MGKTAYICYFICDITCARVTYYPQYLKKYTVSLLSDLG